MARRLVGVGIPVVYGVVRFWLIEWFPRDIDAGLPAILGLLVVGALTGYVLRNWWAVIYTPAVISVFWIIAITAKFGGFSSEGYSSWWVIGTEIAIYLMLVVFAVITGQELGKTLEGG